MAYVVIGAVLFVMGAHIWKLYAKIERIEKLIAHFDHKVEKIVRKNR